MRIAGLVLLWANLALVFGFYSSRDAVIELTPKNFEKTVMGTNQLVAVEFYAPWCGHCQRLAPDWKKAAKNLEGLVKLGAVDCDNDANRPLCAQYEIKGFPTIKVFRPTMVTDKHTGRLTKKAQDYPGGRDARSIVDYMLAWQPSEVRFVKSDASKAKSQKSVSVDEFYATQNETLPKALLFTDKSSTSALYKALSVDFKDRMLVGEVKKAEKALIKEYNVKSYPTLFITSPEAGHVSYEGKMKREALFEFFEKYALPASPTSEEGKKKSKPAPEKEQVASNEDLEKHCLNSGKICVLAITNDEEKTATLEVLEALNKASVTGLYQYSWIPDAKAPLLIKKLDLVADYPSLVLVHPSKELYRPYVGSWNHDAIARWLGQITSGTLTPWSYQGKLIIDEPERVRDEL
ncbi:thioredoxin-like protein [Dichotomocladium elegans]|nr:thioredoxin-like protein [Dichotomocladium elegans]